MNINKESNSTYAKYLGMHLFCYGLKDAFIVYHSPAGCKKKAEYTISMQDLFFTPNHYFDNYINNVESVFGSEDSLIEAIEHVVEVSNPKIIFVITTDTPEIIGFDFETIEKYFYKKYSEKKLIYLQGQAIGGDIFDGYKEALEKTLLSFSPEKNIQKNEHFINIFGYFFTRFEGDFYGDVEEIKNILNSIGLEINTFYGGYSTYSDLNIISSSNTSILFPYSKSSKEILENNYNQKTIELDFPIGLDYTVDFVKKLGNKFNINVTDFLETKTEECVKKINLISHILIGKKVGIIGDSQKLNGLIDFFMDIGLTIPYVIYTDRFENYDLFINKLKIKYDYTENIEVYSNIDRYKIDKIINSTDYSLDLVIGSSIDKASLELDTPFLELFFPASTNHFLNNYTIIGFNGVLNLLTCLYNLLNSPEYYNMSNTLGTLMGDFSFYYDNKLVDEK